MSSPPGQHDLSLEHALAAGLDHSVRRFTDDGGVGLEKVGPGSRQHQKPTVRPGDFLGGIKDDR